MLKCEVKYYKIYDHHFTNWRTQVHDKWVYDDFLKDEDYRKKWISITSVANDDRNNKIYAGIGSFSSELLWCFDRDKKEFESMGYEKIAAMHDGKFHRSLEMDDDGSLYGAIALFHDLDKQFEAKGGRLVRFDTNKKIFDILAVPMERIYVQSIALDKTNKVIYGFGASPEVFWKYDIKKEESRFIAYIGSSAEFGEAHCPVIDDDGRVWGTYGIVRAFAMDPGPDSIRLFYYDPKTDEMEFLKFGLPAVCGDKGKVDTAINGGDGYIYFGTVGGALVRLDPKTTEVKMLGKPSSKGRMTGLARGSDGLLYGIVGDEYDVSLFTYDTKNERFKDMVQFYNREDGISPVRIHHMVMTKDNVIYAGENDNNTRPGYLWECRL